MTASPKGLGPERESRSSPALPPPPPPAPPPPNRSALAVAGAPGSAAGANGLVDANFCKAKINQHKLIPVITNRCLS